MPILWAVYSWRPNRNDREFAATSAIAPDAARSPVRRRTLGRRRSLAARAFAVRSRYLEGGSEESRPDRRGGGVRNDERGGASRRGGGGAERDDHLGGDAHLLRGGGRPYRAGAVLLIRGADRRALQPDHRYRLEWA